ncbi:MAG: hypothetical protein WD378_02105 [Egicoccus sp.]
MQSTVAMKLGQRCNPNAIAAESTRIGTGSDAQAASDDTIGS